MSSRAVEVDGDPDLETCQRIKMGLSWLMGTSNDRCIDQLDRTKN